MRKFVISVLFILSVLGCTAPQIDYIGATESELIRHLGKPSRVTRSKNGDKVFVYKRLYLQESTTDAPSTKGRLGENIVSSGALAKASERERGFFINDKGIVYKIAWGKGN